MPFEVECRYDGMGRPEYLYVCRSPGSRDVPSLSVKADSIIDAFILRNVLNGVHPDTLDQAIRDAVPEADAILRSLSR